MERDQSAQAVDSPRLLDAVMRVLQVVPSWHCQVEPRALSSKTVGVMCDHLPLNRSSILSSHMPGKLESITGTLLCP